MIPFAWSLSLNEWVYHLKGDGSACKKKNGEHYERDRLRRTAVSIRHVSVADLRPGLRGAPFRFAGFGGVPQAPTARTSASARRLRRPSELTPGTLAQRGMLSWVTENVLADSSNAGKASRWENSKAAGSDHRLEKRDVWQWRVPRFRRVQAPSVHLRLATMSARELAQGSATCTSTGAFQEKLVLVTSTMRIPHASSPHPGDYGCW